MPDEGSDWERRDVLRRAGYVAVGAVWVTPVVQSLSGTAWAAETGSVSVKGTKQDREDESFGPGIRGDLASTGAENTTELLVAGTGLVAAGAAAVAVTRHQRKQVPAAEAPVEEGRHRRPKDSS